MKIDDAYFRGRKVSELSRQELLELVEYLAAELSEYRTPEMAHAISLGKVERLKRGLDA